MKVLETELPGVMIVEPKVWGDSRGFFMETYHERKLFDATGISSAFVQDNQSGSVRGVLRGLHFQEPNAQGKLVRAGSGVIWDVAADIRKGSPSFGKWVAVELSAENKRQLWIPAGFAHGFCVLSDWADLLYKCTRLYEAENDRGILWNDPDLAIDWPVKDPILSPKDVALPRLSEAPILPEFHG